MKQILSSLFVLIVLTNSYYADNSFASDNTVYAKNHHAKNVCLSKGGTSSGSVNKKVYAAKGSNQKRKNKVSVGGGVRNICLSKGGTSSGGVNKKVCSTKYSKSKGGIGSC